MRLGTPLANRTTLLLRKARKNKPRTEAQVVSLWHTDRAQRTTKVGKELPEGKKRSHLCDEQGRWGTEVQSWNLAQVITLPGQKERLGEPSQQRLPIDPSNTHATCQREYRLDEPGAQFFQVFPECHRCG